MGILSTLRFITSHPLTKGKKGETLGRWLSWQIGARLVPGPVVVPFVNNSRLLVYPGMTGATGNIYTGLHEFEDMSFLLHFLRPDDLFVDVGANIGSYTILAGSVVGARCISIEPIPETFQTLMKNINLNDIRHLVNALNIGLGKENGYLRFTSALDTVNHVVVETDQNSIEVKSSTLDTVVGEASPTLIKIDVEGFESNVISGADNALSKDSLNAVIMELNGSGSRYGFDKIELHKRMINYGFNPFAYSPFDRTLISQDGKKLKSGNALYLRNAAFVKERIASAPAFYVNGREI